MEISTPTHPRTSKKHGKGQADGGGQVFHTESLARNIWDGQGGMGALNNTLEIFNLFTWRVAGKKRLF